jgi:hypothetical protein
MEAEEIGIAGDDEVGAAGQGKFEELVVFWGRGSL